MGYALDLVIVAIIVITIWFGYKNGFIKTVMSALSFFIALVVAFTFRQALSDRIMQLPLVDGVRDTVKQEFINLAPKGSEADEFDSEKLIEEKPEGFGLILKIAGIDEDEIKAKYETWKEQDTEKAADMLVEYVAEPIMEGLASIVSFLSLFAITMIVLRIIIFLLDYLFKLPVLKQANKLLGTALGVLLGLFRAYVFGAIITLLMPVIQTNNPNLAIGNSFIFNFFYGNANLLINFFK